jgi:hypothetical protein
VARICRRAGLSRLSQLDPVAHYPRYERARPGELLHLDVKKLGRITRVGHRITGDRRDTVGGAGWEYVHVAIDDCSRVAYCQVLPDEEGVSACADLGIRHRRTRPCTPRTNGKAERFIQSALREWADARAYGTSAQRINAMPRWLHGYNWHRAHASLAGQPPTSRLSLNSNNLLRLHS